MDLRPYNKVYGQELGLDVSLCFGFRCSAAAETREDKGRRRRRGGRRGKREFIHCAPAAVISASQAGGGAARADADWNARNVRLSLSLSLREREREKERESGSGTHGSAWALGHGKGATVPGNDRLPTTNAARAPHRVKRA